MDRLSTFNIGLARVVFAAAALFAVSTTLLAAITGELALLAGTAMGFGAGAYAFAVARKPSGELVRLPRPKQPAAA